MTTNPEYDEATKRALDRLEREIEEILLTAGYPLHLAKIYAESFIEAGTIEEGD